MSADHIHFFLQLRNQIKLYHWQTRIYARHIATDQILEKLDKNIDSFVEIYIGKYGRPKFTGTSSTIKLENFHDKDAFGFIKDAANWLSKKLPKHLKKTDTDLLNIRDTILADLNQVSYLFTLH